MDDYKSMGVVQCDEQVIAMAQNIVKALETSKIPTDDMMIRVLLDFNICLARNSQILEKKGNVSEIEERFASVLEKVMNWNSDRSMIWNPGLGETSKHLQGIDEIKSLIESLESLSLEKDREKDELLQIAHSILQMAMSWLQCDEQVIVIAQNIVKAFETSKIPTDYMMIRVLLNFNICLARNSQILGKKGNVRDIEERFASVLEEVMNWNSDRSMIWNPGLGETSKHLQAIGEIQRLTESLERLSLKIYRGKDELLQIARSILHMAMSWLEKELIKILVENRQPLEPERISLFERRSLVICDFNKFDDDDSDEDTQAMLQRDNSKGSEDFIVDLIHPDVIADLKCIAEVMFMSNFD